MEFTEYQKMSELEEHYWWHIGRKSILSHQLKRLNLPDPKILNVGCGTGGMIPLFNQYGRVSNVDVADEAIEECRRKGFLNVEKIDGIDLPYAANSFDLVVATDVLEHIEEDQSALAEWFRVLKPGGNLLITIPAYQWLWSEHDESLHHHRRYTSSGIHRLLNKVGYHMVKRSYIIVFSFPLIVGYRAVQSLLPNNKDQQTSYVILPKVLNKMFVTFLQVEARALKYVNFPFGTSVLIIAQKPR